MCAPSGPHPVIFDRLDGEMIRRVTIQMNGAAGPSGLDGKDSVLIIQGFVK